MKTMDTAGATELDDAELVASSLAGDREAFNAIVSRYQTLICSLAYSAMGNLGQSEDLAQETFITAWRRLGHLREPSKLRAWLCGIVRNRIHKSLRREGRDPVHVAEPLDSALLTAAPDALPSDRAISREEESILWRSLGRIPEIYREPLILFYRENQSVLQVAARLDLSEDVVKQRLSRGRKLLQETVQDFVESALRRTAPGRSFSSGVMAALPLTAGAAGGGGAGLAGKGMTTGKSGLLAGWLMPLVAVVWGMIAHWMIVRAAPSREEQRTKKVAFTFLWVFAIGWCVAGQLCMRVVSRHYQWSDGTYFAVMTGYWWFYGAVVATWGVVIFRRLLGIRREKDRDPDAAQYGRPLGIGARIAMVCGVYVACFWWLIDLAVQAHDTDVAIGIGILMTVMALVHFTQARMKTGVAAMHAVILQLALVWGVILLIVNWRLETWEASLHGLTLPEMHALLPPWVLHSLTAGLVLWVAALLFLTRPGRTRQAAL